MPFLGTTPPTTPLRMLAPALLPASSRLPPVLAPVVLRSLMGDFLLAHFPNQGNFMVTLGNAIQDRNAAPTVLNVGGTFMHELGSLG